MSARGSKTALIADTGLISVSLDNFLERVEALNTSSESLMIGFKASRDDEEFLEVDSGLSVGTAVDDVHARSRDDFRIGSADITI